MTETTPTENGTQMRRLQPPSRHGGARLPVGTGRPKGQPNRVTKTIREAVELAAREVTDSKGRKGLAAWMLERAAGGIQDRQIFAAMVSKALPLTVQGNIGGVTINLGWLEGRGLAPVTVAAQPARKSLILEADTRSNDPQSDQEAAATVQAESATAADGDPPPPFDRQEGGSD